MSVSSSGFDSHGVSDVSRQVSAEGQNLIATSEGTVIRIFDPDKFMNHRIPGCRHVVTVRPIPRGFSVDNRSPMCSTCGEHTETWMCLVCHLVFCGRFAQGHMVAHHSDTGHCVSISMQDLSVWCYACDTYLDYDNFPLLQTFFARLHSIKFGEQPPIAQRLIGDHDPDRGGGMAGMAIAGSVASEAASDSDDALNSFGLGDLASHSHGRRCSHLRGISQLVPKDGEGWLSKPCEKCHNKGENWVCAACLRVFCGRFVEKHMMQHHADSPAGHEVCISLADLSVWCYGCVQYLDPTASSRLYNLFVFFHRIKFGSTGPFKSAPHTHNDNSNKNIISPAVRSISDVAHVNQTNNTTSSSSSCFVAPSTPESNRHQFHSTKPAGISVDNHTDAHESAALSGVSVPAAFVMPAGSPEVHSPSK